MSEPSFELEQNKNISNAGGSNTNYYGKKFEDKTNNHKRLLENGYIKKYYSNMKNSSDSYLSKKFEGLHFVSGHIDL